MYEYIIFRGSDIKDIRVCEPPKPQATLQGGLPNDPAIVKVLLFPWLVLTDCFITLQCSALHCQRWRSPGWEGFRWDWCRTSRQSHRAGQHSLLWLNSLRGTEEVANQRGRGADQGPPAKQVKIINHRAKGLVSQTNPEMDTYLGIFFRLFKLSLNKLD